VLQRVAVCCSVLHCVAVCVDIAVMLLIKADAVVCCSVLQYVAVC